MKKGLLFPLFLFIALASYSQKIGATFGLTSTNVSKVSIVNRITRATETVETNPGLGIRTGLVLEYEYMSGITLGVNGLYSTKSYKYNIASEEIIEKFKFFEVPVYFGYTYTIDDKVGIIYNFFPIKIYLYGGLNFATGLSGANLSPIKPEDGILVIFDDTKTVDARKEIHYAKTNPQAMFQLGFLVGGLRLNVCYEFGLSNLANDEKETLKTKGFNFNLAYVYDFKQKRWPH
ncbi:MAG: hypothetical protein IPO21_04075 [Bacteroidales bacterium]|nr:hypothetical protein [Bacteroidales bacterium]